MADDEMHGDDLTEEDSGGAGAVPGGEDPAGPEPPFGAETPAGAEVPADAETGAGADPAAGEEAVPTSEELLRSVNRLVEGELTLHYPSRDVALALDGASALRLLTMFWRRSGSGLADVMDPGRTSALGAWIVLDLTEPMAMSWRPTLGPNARRTALDPPVANA